MTNSEKFAGLLNAYLSGKATDENYNELMRLIKDGSYDELLKQKIDDALRNGSSIDDINEEKARRLLFSILNSEKQTAELITIKRRVRSPWLWAAAAAVIAIAFTMFQLFTAKHKKADKEIIAKKENKTVQPAHGSKVQKYVRLQDGSTVLLNEGSKLDYPDTFSNTTREVTLIGEGYFDIRHEANRPFIVHTGKVETTVLGTAFNIKAYPQQKEIRVTVTRGKVKVSNNKETIGVITPNESITVNTENKLYVQQKVNADTVVEWKKQYLVLDNISMGDAAVLIDGRYHVNISFSNENLKACRISAMFLDNENLEQVLTVVTGVVNASYTAQPNDQIIISGEGCN